MKTKPTISIISASYNHANFIGEMIESVKLQNYDSWELLIADDCSTDHTLEVLKPYLDDERIKLFSFKINREHHMRNFALKHARGDYIAFLNSDDIFLPGKLRKQVEYLENNPLTAAVFTHVKMIDENSVRISGSDLEEIFKVTNRSRHQWLRHFFTIGNCFCISSVLIRRNSFEQVGAFNPLLIQISDMDLWVRICLKWDVHVINEQLTSMRILDKDKNLSTMTATSISRTMFEYQHMYSHYFTETAILQTLEIFPELIGMLPEETPAWRYYLICRIATSLTNKAARFNGFSKLHALLSNEDTKIKLLQKNPRLLRSLFIAEGTASIWYDHYGVLWKICPTQNKSSCDSDMLYSYWTGVANKAVVCFSFPNPSTSDPISLKIEAGSIRVICHQIRLYNQETGNIIWDSGHLQQEDIHEPKNEGNVLAKSDQCNCPYFNFPEIHFTEISAKWIDIEIEVETYIQAECIPPQPRLFLRLIKKILGKRYLKVKAFLFHR